MHGVLKEEWKMGMENHADVELGVLKGICNH